MWRQIDVQADWRRSWNYGRAPNDFVGFFNVPVQAPPRGHVFYGYSEKPPHLVALYDTLGIRRTCSHLKPPGSQRGHQSLEGPFSSKAMAFQWVQVATISWGPIFTFIQIWVHPDLALPWKNCLAQINFNSNTYDLNLQIRSLPFLVMGFCLSTHTARQSMFKIWQFIIGTKRLASTGKRHFQVYATQRLQSTPRKFMGPGGDLIKVDRVPDSRIISDILHREIIVHSGVRSCTEFS